MKCAFRFRDTLLTLACFVILLSCRKEERLYTFIEKEKLPPATNKDTAISVTASLNGDSFLALGRANAPAGNLTFSFYNIATGSFLDIKIGADTPGVYKMGRSVAAHTAVYYLDAMKKSESKGYTSRATEEAGGTVTVTTVDTINHRIKGMFELLLLSRTSPERYDFKTGSFDILYNYAQMELNGQSINASPQADLTGGTSETPVPVAIINLPDSLFLRIELSKYKGPGSYSHSDEINIVFGDKKNGKRLQAVTAKADIIRFNFAQFLQMNFECSFKEEDGTMKAITNGSFVIGN